MNKTQEEMEETIWSVLNKLDYSYRKESDIYKPYGGRSRAEELGFAS